MGSAKRVALNLRLPHGRLTSHGGIRNPDLRAAACGSFCMSDAAFLCRVRCITFQISRRASCGERDACDFQLQGLVRLCGCAEASRFLQWKDLATPR